MGGPAGCTYGEVEAEQGTCNITKINNNYKNTNCSHMGKGNTNMKNKELKVNTNTENNKDKKNKIINRIGDFLKWCRINSNKNKHTSNTTNEIQKSNKRKNLENNQDNEQPTK